MTTTATTTKVPHVIRHDFHIQALVPGRTTHAQLSVIKAAVEREQAEIDARLIEFSVEMPSVPTVKSLFGAQVNDITSVGAAS